MKKAWLLFVLAAIVGIGLRYVLPKDMVFPEKEKKYVDEFLAETLQEFEEEEDVDTVSPIGVVNEDVKGDEGEVDEPEIVVEDWSEENPLVHFFEKLRELELNKKGQVRVAYFGDSMLDADMLVMQFRHYLQGRFGGEGVGFVPVTSPSASGRYSIKHSFSPEWEKQTFLRKNDTIFPFGINGETFFVGDTAEVKEATVTYRRGSAYRELGLVNPFLLYGKRRVFDSIALAPALVTLTSDDGEEVLELNGEQLVNSISLPTYQKSLKIKVQDQGIVPFYGVSFASPTGVIVDNLAIRGNSGLPLTRLGTGLMRQFNKKFGYDLIILSYGTNVFSPDYTKGFAWYGKRMERVVKHLKNCFNNVDVIVVSMADRALKDGDEMKTPPELNDFIQVQKNIADSTKSAFFNLYATMGGEGSMKEWVEAEPPLANKDYTHFNSAGAEKAGKLFYNWLIHQYEEYVKSIPQKVEEEIEEGVVSETVEEIFPVAETQTIEE